MKRGSTFFLGFALGAVLMGGCATIFPWPYYATQMPDSCYSEGTLLGKSGSGGWPDRKLEDCEPDPDPSPGASPGPAPDKLKCITMLVDDFYDLQADDEKCHADLDACQAGPQPTGYRITPRWAAATLVRAPSISTGR